MASRAASCQPAALARTRRDGHQRPRRSVPGSVPSGHLERVRLPARESVLSHTRGRRRGHLVAVSVDVVADDGGVVARRGPAQHEARLRDARGGESCGDEGGVVSVDVQGLVDTERLARGEAVPGGVVRGNLEQVGRSARRPLWLMLVVVGDATLAPLL